MWALPFARNRPEWASRWLEKLEAGNVTGVAQRQKASVEEALQHIEASRIPHLTEIYALFDGRAAVVIGIQGNVHRLDAFVVLNGSFKRKLQCSQKRT